MDDGGKRVSWVELYLDLVFVLAVGQLAHLIVGEPEMRSVWIALGLFFTLWWTWVGFTVLYNRTGADEPAQRLLFLVASVPAGVAAVAVAPVSTGDSAVLAASLALTRLILAAAHGANESLADLLRLRIARACLLSASTSRSCSGRAGRRGWRGRSSPLFLFSSRRVSGVARALLLVATFQLARLEGELSAHAYLWLLTGWVVMCAALTTRTVDDEELERYLRSDASRPSRRRRYRASTRRSG